MLQDDTYSFDTGGNVAAVYDALAGQRQCFGYVSPGGCVAGTPAIKPYAVSSMSGLGSYGAYDCAGRVTSRTLSSGAGAGTHSFTWDAFGRLAGGTSVGVTTKNVYGPGGARLVRVDGSTRTLYLPFQELTSVAGATATRYYPYAAVRSGANALAYDHGFLGQIEDDRTTLKYLNNRYHVRRTATWRSRSA